MSSSKYRTVKFLLTVLVGSVSDVDVDALTYGLHGYKVGGLHPKYIAAEVTH